MILRIPTKDLLFSSYLEGKEKEITFTLIAERTKYFNRLSEEEKKVIGQGIAGLLIEYVDREIIQYILDELQQLESQLQEAEDSGLIDLGKIIEARMIAGDYIQELQERYEVE